MPPEITDNELTSEQKQAAESLEGIKGLSAVMQGLKEGISTLNRRMDTIETNRITAANIAEDEADKRPDVTEDQLDDMSRSQFMTHMISTINDTLVQPVAERIDGDAAALRKGDATKLIEAAAAAHPDFNEFSKEIATIARTMPGITPERAYQMARAEDPAKSVEMDMKYETDEQKKVKADAKALEEANSGDTPFGGLAPTSGVPAEKVDFKDDREAFDDAWKTHVTDEGLEGAFRT
jgi:hypothetical protein